MLIHEVFTFSFPSQTLFFFVCLHINAGLEAPDLLPLQHGAGGQGPRLRLLGAGLARVDLFPPRGGAPHRAVAGEPAREAVRGQVCWRDYSLRRRGWR